MNDNYEDLLAFAKRLAQQAGSIMRDYFDRDTAGQHVVTKQNNTPVTEADELINQLVITEVERVFPAHGVLGEEASDHAERRQLWVCDPIDGTRSFVEGEPTSVFSLAFVVDGTPQVAVVYDPFQDKLYSAAKGKGAFCNDQPLHVSGRGMSEAILGLSGRLREIQRRASVFERLEREGARISFHGGGIFKMILVATGKKEGTIFPGTEPHDAAAAKLIVEEAGGRVTDLAGNEQRYDGQTGGVIVSNGVIHDQLVAAVSEFGVEAYKGFKK